MQIFYVIIAVLNCMIKFNKKMINKPIPLHSCDI